MLKVYRKILSLLSLFRARPAEAGVLGSIGGFLLRKGVKKFKDFANDNTVAGLKEKAKKGDSDAQYRLGLIYHDGKEDEEIMRDYSEALRWFRMASDNGYAPAQYMLGLMYYNGEGLLENYEEAFNLFLKSAHQAYASAQFKVACMYYDGEGTAKNYEEAFKWF